MSPHRHTIDYACAVQRWTKPARRTGVIRRALLCVSCWVLIGYLLSGGRV